MSDVLPGDVSRDDRVNEAIASFLDARDRGEAPDPRAYLARHPEIARELSQFFADQAAFRRAAVGAPSDSSSNAGVAVGPRAGEIGLGMLRDYLLLQRLGQGGMGTVYKARHIKLKRTVALKVLPRDRMRDPAAIARFEREMEAVGKLEHPNIVRALDAGEHDGTHYLVMEFVTGADLAKVVEQCGPLAIADACELARQAAVALQHAHEHGLVHRDIKPSNLMLNTAGQVKLLDLGLALLGDPQANRELTSDNQLMGTADYIAPEQAGDSHSVDIRADVYSLGCTLYRLLTGEAPFAGPRHSNFLQKVLAHAGETIPSIVERRGEAPAALDSVVARMMAKRPADRYATPAEVAQALAPFCAGSDLARLASPAEGAIAQASPTPLDGSHGNAPTDPYLANSLTGTHSAPSTGPANVTAVGIDLGTTYSVIAYLDAQGRPTSIPNSEGDLLTPSVVVVDDDSIVVGKQAVLAGSLESHKVADCVKRDIGSKHYHKRVNGRTFPPEVISAYILQRLKTDAERKLGPLHKAVITVPAYFDETRRRATMDAGKLAGLEVLDIINEPTAAAIVYGYQTGFLDRSGKVQREKPVRVLVFDLGGGTFDVTLVEIASQSFKALATDGDVLLGGKDWDEKLVEIAAERLKSQLGDDPRCDPATLHELTFAAEAAKRTLSERTKATLVVHRRGQRLKVDVTRQEFEEATLPLVLRTRAATELVVLEAGVSWQDIDRVLVVGGSTRMPMIVRMLTELAGRAVDHSVSPDEAVAHGAALYADMLLQKQGLGGRHTHFNVTNVNSHSLGVVGVDANSGVRVNRVIIPKNTSLPHAESKRFKTFQANQLNVKVTVLEGESEMPDGCIEVGTCVIRGLPPNLPAGWPVEVRYAYEENGRLHVSAKLVGHGAQVTAEFVRDNSLSDDDLLLWGQVLADELIRYNQ